MANSTNSTLDRMARESTLWGSWARVAAGSAMAGADGIGVETFGRQLGVRLDHLAEQLRTRTYEPQPLRLMTITRGGKRRRLGLPTVRDRVTQRAFLEVCGKRLDASSAEVSFAYRRGRSWLDALAQAERCRDAGLRTVLRADIAEFFREIDHELLADALNQTITDPEAAALARAWASAPLLTEYGVVDRDRGVPEGAPVSPALANLYLRGFDKAVHGRRGHLVRYADDLAVFCPDEDAALAAAADVDAALTSLRLRTNPGKTYVSTFDTGFSFLGWVFFRDGGWAESPNEGWTHPMSVGRNASGHRLASGGRPNGPARFGGGLTGAGQSESAVQPTTGTRPTSGTRSAASGQERRPWR
ncbi:reverse transcriptase domain-containing protein [Protofrankia symbiont of Coriaria ruscifolia]|uniref:reverse transcriptase domain-containing protein n=1 Tax=Protofrankia symbiont of Coriaria ruscifolia TaxID=1306542 RepID=UPI0010414612|nr:reverse transcriptase domain-containing protein [Protofrankia symbiont of Coriaria ruscifolia]